MILKFEHWQQGDLMQVLTIQADSINAAVSELSEQYKGVFRLIQDVDERYDYDTADIWGYNGDGWD